MAGTKKIKTALISVFHKDGLDLYCDFFCEKFWRLTKKHYLCTRNQERWRDSSAG